MLATSAPCVMVILTVSVMRAVSQTLYQHNGLNPCNYEGHKIILRDRLRNSRYWSDVEYYIHPHNEYASLDNRVCFLVTKPTSEGLTNAQADQLCSDANGELMSVKNEDELRSIQSFLTLVLQENFKSPQVIASTYSEDLPYGERRWVISPYFDPRIWSHGFKYKGTFAKERVTSLGAVRWNWNLIPNGKQISERDYILEDVPLCFVLTTKPDGSVGFKVEIRREECNDQAVLDNYSATPGGANAKISHGRGVICEYRPGHVPKLSPSWTSWVAHPPTADNPLQQCDSSFRTYSMSKCDWNWTRLDSVYYQIEPVCLLRSQKNDWVYPEHPCIYRPVVQWTAWTQWTPCNRNYRDRSAQCVQAEQRRDRVIPESCDDKQPLADRGQCTCGGAYWSAWTTCKDGMKSKERCGRFRNLTCQVDVYPSWTDWGLWTECFEGVRTKTHKCFIDRQKVDSTKNYYNFVKCAVETSSESAPCEDTCNYLDFLGKTFTYNQCYTIIGGMVAGLGLVWVVCLTCGCGKKSGYDKVIENYKKLKAGSLAKSNKKKKGKR